MLADTRPPIPVQPGQPRRQDYEYRRGGTRNIFLTCEPLAGWRHVAITERRTMQDFAHQMQWLVDVAYPDAPVSGSSWKPRIKYGAGSEYPSYGVPLRDLSAPRSPTHYQTPRVSPHAQTRQLAGSCLELADALDSCHIIASLRVFHRRRTRLEWTRPLCRSPTGPKRNCGCSATRGRPRRYPH